MIAEGICIKKNCILKTLECKLPQDNLYVIAFSQGAVLTEIMLVNELFPKDIIPKKVLLISPSGIMDNNFHKESKVKVDSDVMVIFGEREGIYNLSKEQYIQSTFIENINKFYTHSQGHVIPSNSNDKKIIREFIS